MSVNLEDLAAQALALPPEQRCELAQRLWESVEAPIGADDEVFAEIDRRDAEVASGLVAPIPFDQAMREIRDALK